MIKKCFKRFHDHLQIYSLLLSAIAKFFQCNQEAKFEVPKFWIQALREGANAIQKYGKASLGDRTMVCFAQTSNKGMGKGRKEPINRKKIRIRAK